MCVCKRSRSSTGSQVFVSFFVVPVSTGAPFPLPASQPVGPRPTPLSPQTHEASGRSDSVHLRVTPGGAVRQEGIL